MMSNRNYIREDTKYSGCATLAASPFRWRALEGQGGFRKNPSVFLGREISPGAWPFEMCAGNVTVSEGQQ